jgi:hypothetical protein
VHGDVLRPPRYLVILSAVVGTGAQLALLVLLVILLAIIGMLYIGYVHNPLTDCNISLNNEFNDIVLQGMEIPACISELFMRCSSFFAMDFIMFVPCFSLTVN